MMKKIGKIVENVVMVVAVVVVLFFGAMVILPRFDYGLIVIKSGSMEPAIKTGSVVITKRQDNYNKKDIITFAREKKELVTHRIVEVVEEDGNVSYRTRGDHNNTDDTALTIKKKVIGKTLFTIPYLGWLVAFLKTKIGVIILILIPTIYFITLEILKIKKELRKRKEETSKK